MVQLSGGEFHSCGVTRTGGVLCWGSNRSGQLGAADASSAQRETAVPVQGLASGVRQVSVGQAHSCALLLDGSVRCWGENGQGQLGVGGTTDRSQPGPTVALGGPASAIAVGEEHSCALLNSGQLRCWGRNDLGQLGDGTTQNRTTPTAVVLPGGSANVLTAGAGHTCAVIGGVVHCWGRNDSGQLGDGSLTQRVLPTPVAGVLTGVTALAAGRLHSCALTPSGASCWGSNSDGQLGDGSTTNRRIPVAVSGLGSGLRRLVANFRHSCVLDAGGAVLCWGDNFFGQIGDGTDRDRSLPTAVTGLGSGLAELAAGYRHNCAASTDGLLARCWGNNFDGQLGNGAFTNKLVPVPVNGLTAGTQRVALGFQHSCAWSPARGTECWGDGTSGQLGDGLGTSAATPVRVQLSDGSGALAGGVFHTCSVTLAGGIKCWGENGNGQLGDGTATDRLLPTEVVGLEGAQRSVAAGGFHTCAVAVDGRMSCWGSNSNGQLGIGGSGSRTTPAPVEGLPGPVQVASAGEGHTCALTVAGGVLCWGDNSAGQLGDGSNTSRGDPAVVPGLETGVSAVSVNGDYSCALLASGAVRCWGSNAFGQLGSGSTINRATPGAINGLSERILGIGTAWYHACAIGESGTAYCWGRNIEGQVGDNSTLQRTRAVKVVGLGADAASTFGGGGQNCVLKSSGALLCWGANNFGQVGDGTTWAVRQPVNVLVDEDLPKIVSLAAGANAGSTFASVDDSGRFVLFQSAASSLVSGDGNGSADVFRVDRRSGERVRVSLDNGGREIVGASIEPAMSSDGQRIVFVAADAAVAEVLGETLAARSKRLKNTGQAVFLRNMLTGTTQRIGPARPQGNGTLPDIDPSGTRVVWTQPNADASVGVAGQDNIYLSRLTPQAGGAVAVGAAQCLTCKVLDAAGQPTTTNADGASQMARMSRDGGWLVWQSAAKNVRIEGKAAPVCTASSSTIYLRNMLTGSVREVSAPAAGGSCGGSGQSASAPAIDAAGNQVVFQSGMPLAPGDSNGASDVFLWRQDGGGPVRLSNAVGGADSGVAATSPNISDDGRMVAFASAASGIDASFADNNDVRDVHVVQTSTGATSSARLSRSSTGGEASAASDLPALSGDGTSVVFETAAANLSVGVAGGAIGIVQRPNPLLPALRSGIWWNPAESGWGLFVFDQGDVLAAAWYTYDNDGEPTWFLLPARIESPGVYAGQILRFTGTPFDRIGSTTNAVDSLLGNGRLKFASGRLDFQYTVGATTQTKTLEPFPFGGRQVECRAHTGVSRSTVTDYSDIWQGTASGWGLFIVQVDDQLFPAWYTYDADGEAIFLIGLATRRSDGSFNGPLFRQANGTPYLQINGSPASTDATQVGDVTLRFSNGDTGTFEYSVGAVRQTKTISRLPFGSTPSACSTNPSD